VDEADALTDQSCGSFAAELLARRAKRLVALQLDVLADRDPEPLHQMRVTCRQMRSTVEQFADALILPEQVSSQRLARIGSDLGLSRDLDVLQQRLERQWWPLLPEEEQEALRKLMKQLKRERKLAFSLLSDTLKGRRYLKFLSRLQAWLKDPQFTPMGAEPIALWSPELQQIATEGLFSLPGWWVTNLAEPKSNAALHRLRRRIKRARYGLANLAGLELEGLKPWIAQFKQLQTSLGELQDLQVLVSTLERLLEGPPDAAMPVLFSFIVEARDQAWAAWIHASADLRTLAGRQRLLSLQVLPTPG
jgi:CHAD domain-containing protein